MVWNAKRLPLRLCILLPLAQIALAIFLLGQSDRPAVRLRQVSSSNSAILWPGTIIPDGQGGIVSTWVADSSLIGSQQQHPYQGADVVPGVAAVNPYNLPQAPTGTFNQDQTTGLPVNLQLVLGSNGTVLGSYGTNVVSYVAASGSANWNYQAPGQDVLSLVEATSDGGLTINDSVVGAVQLDPNGNVLGSASSLNGASPFTFTSWVGVTKATLDEWTKSVSELATWIRYAPPAAGAKPVEPWFEDLREDDDNDGGPETIN